MEIISDDLEHSALAAQSQNPPFSIIHEIAFVATICFAQLMTQASLGQAVAPLHVIGNSFGTKNPGELSWYIAAYSLTVGTFILIAGRYGDVFGHRKMMIIGYLWYALWSMLTGLSVYSNQIFFDICRAFQGIGPAIILPNAIAILGRTYSPGLRKAMAFSLFGGVAPTGFILGAVFASWIAQKSWWPWAFWVNAIVDVLLAFLSFVVVPKDDQAALLPFSVGHLDITGSIVGVSGLVLFNVAWNQGPIVGWTTPYTYILLILGILALGAFFAWETKAYYPILPFKTFTGDTGYVLACVAAGWSTFGIWVYYFFQFMELLRKESPLQVSAKIVPVGISGMAAAITTGFLLGKIHAGWVMLCAMFAFTVGTIIIATTPVNQIYWAQTFVALLVIPWGMDMSFPSATIVLSNGMPREHQGIAASLVATVVNYSISIGLGIAGTVETNIDKGGHNLLRGFRSAWYTGIGLGVVGILISITFILKQSTTKTKQEPTEQPSENKS